MSIISIAVKHLIAAGVTGDALVTAIEEMEQALKPAKTPSAERQARYRDRLKERNSDITTVTTVTGVTNVTEKTSSNGFPHLSLTPSKEKTPKGVKKKVSLQELSVEHIRPWLAKKRSEGKFLCHDENEILEIFKNYCQAKAVKYEDYPAAYRNAFRWEQCQPKPNQKPAIQRKTI